MLRALTALALVVPARFAADTCNTLLVQRMDTFNALDQVPETVAWDQYPPHSNPSAGLCRDASRGVLAHQQAHLIEHAYDHGEEPWLGET